MLVSHWSFTFWWAELTLSQGLSFSCCLAREWAGGAHSRIRAADPTDQKHILLSFHKASTFIFFSVSPWLPLISQKGYWPSQIRGSSSQQIYVGISHPPLRLQTQAKHQDKRILKSDNSLEQQPTDRTQISCTQAKPWGCYQQLSLIWDEINRFIILLSICYFTTEEDLQKFKGPVLEIGKTNNVASITALLIFTNNCRTWIYP